MLSAAGQILGTGDQTVSFSLIMNQLEIEGIKRKAAQAITPLASAAREKYFWGERTKAGQDLPPYYIVYFLLADLLCFPTLGKQEKVAWSIVVQMDGKTFVIEHRKMGLGIFAQSLATDEVPAAKIVRLLWRGVKVAEDYFDWLAEAAVANSELNLLNKNQDLFDRFQYFLALHRTAKSEAKARKGDSLLDFLPSGNIQFRNPSHFDFEREADWLAISAIEAFFSWTEHLFIHLALLKGTIASGNDAATLAEADWAEKFKQAIGFADVKAKNFYDDLLQLRRQVRNFVAHGAFGKRGEAFQFHSKVGAVPVLMPHNRKSTRFALLDDLSFREETALKSVEDFVDFLRTGSDAPAFEYLQGSNLPTILTRVNDGTYKAAMASVVGARALRDSMEEMFGRSADMDW